MMIVSFFEERLSGIWRSLADTNSGSASTSVQAPAPPSIQIPCESVCSYPSTWSIDPSRKAAVVVSLVTWILTAWLTAARNQSVIASKLSGSCKSRLDLADEGSAGSRERRPPRQHVLHRCRLVPDRERRACHPGLRRARAR